MEGKYADEGAHADHEIKVPDPPTTDEDDSDPESSDDIFTALRKRSAKVEFSFQKALSKMNQGSSLRDMATPTPRSACWDYFRAAEKGFRELNAELQELSALHTSLAVPIPLELQKYLARCPYELAYTIYYLGAINTARYAETQPLIYEARSRLMTLRDTVEELQAEKLSSLVLRAEENADNERRSRTMNAGSALTPLGGKADEDAADASSSLLSGPLRPIRSERRPDSASSSSSSRSSASSMSSGASSRQHSPPSASSKATKSEVSRSLLSPELPEDSNPSTSRSSSLLSPELPEDAPPPSNALTKLRQQSSSSSSALTRSSGAETERAEKSVNEKDFVGKASHSSFMPMSNEELLKYIAERLETLDSLEAVIVAGIADRDDFVQEQYRARLGPHSHEAARERTCCVCLRKSGPLPLPIPKMRKLGESDKPTRKRSAPQDLPYPNTRSGGRRKLVKNDTAPTAAAVGSPVPAHGVASQREVTGASKAEPLSSPQLQPKTEVATSSAHTPSFDAVTAGSPAPGPDAASQDEATCASKAASRGSSQLEPKSQPDTSSAGSLSFRDIPGGVGSGGTLEEKKTAKPRRKFARRCRLPKRKLVKKTPRVYLLKDRPDLCERIKSDMGLPDSLDLPANVFAAIVCYKCYLKIQTSKRRGKRLTFDSRVPELLMNQPVLSPGVEHFHGDTCPTCVAGNASALQIINERRTSRHS